MANFCTKCNDFLFGDKCTPDIDVVEEFKQLKPSYYITTLCEGCTLCAISNDNGKMKVMYLNDKEPENWEDYETSWKEHYGRSE